MRSTIADYTQVAIVLRQFSRGHRVTPDQARDLYQEGAIGLIEASRRFDPAKGCRLNTFTDLRIRGAMQDALRRGDFLSRSQRKAVQRGEAEAPVFVAVQHWHATRDDVYGQALAAERRRLVEAVLPRLPVSERSVMRALLQGDRAVEIARDWGCTDGYIGQLKTRAIARIRVAIGLEAAQ